MLKRTETMLVHSCMRYLEACEKARA